MAEKSPLQPAKSGRAGATLALGCAIPFGLVFICTGCAILWMMTLRPLAQVAASINWQPVDAVILSSSVETENNSDGENTYRVAIRYRYVWPPAAQAVEADPSAPLGTPASLSPALEYIGERYDFSVGRTSVAVDDMHAVVAAHPPGARVTCLVDPDAPDSAVIDRSPPLHVWMGFGFGVFPLAGIGVIVGAWHSRRIANAAAKTQTSSETPVGELPLNLAESRATAFIGLGFVTLFWNGIVSVFVIIAFKEFGNGFIGWFLPVFLIPFVLVGLALLSGFVHSISRLFAPPAHAWLENAPPRLGITHRLRWRLRGSGVRRLRIRLRVREESVYRRGTDTVTDHADLVDEIMFDSSDALALREGAIPLALPDSGLVPAFNAPNNRLSWEILFEGEIPRRADLDDRFVLPVLGPSAIAPAAVVETTPLAHAGPGFVLWTPERFAPGDTLVFTLARDAAAPPGPLTVRLGWFTEGRGTSDSAIVWSETIPDLPPGADCTFETPLPAAPWSFAGSLLSLEWRLEIVDRKNRPLTSARLVVAPGGEPVRLRPPLPEEPKPKTSWWRSLRLAPR